MSSILYSQVIGGGLPVGAYGGRRDIMEMVAPAGPMYQAGTLSGNPLAMAAGIKVTHSWKVITVAALGRILDLLHNSSSCMTVKFYCGSFHRSIEIPLLDYRQRRYPIKVIPCDCR